MHLTVNRNIYSGGLTNIIYRCALHDHVRTFYHEPREVLLRIYGDSPGDIDVQLEVFNQLAQAKLGPMLYSAFNGGRFEEYLPSNALSWSLMTSDDVAAIIARKFSAIHRLEVKSLEKRSDWLIERYKEYSNYISDAKAKNEFNFLPDTLDSTKKIANEMLNVDFKHEIDYLAELFKKSTAPLVFSHNDLNQNNILLLHDKDLYLEDRIVLIDFEYSSYNYRTFDIANHLTEWCFDYSGDEYPFFTFYADRFPSEEKQKRFLAEYISINNFNDDSDFEQNSAHDKIEALYVEMQPFLMAANFLWTIWAIKSALTSEINFGYWVSYYASFAYSNIHNTIRNGKIDY